MAKSNKDDIVNGILEYKLIESFVNLGSAAKEDAKRNGTYQMPGSTIIAAFLSPNRTIWQKILVIEMILLPIVIIADIIIMCL